ncbi:ABC transporter ATP-binding protein [Tundrisphaera sp. TA3]|uniref:ABC transporter ATP-binding protein n=1 Tax=Tundrisphaera sp. TA3 TaxID=3435775 RepID=UPI003EB7ED5A
MAVNPDWPRGEAIRLEGVSVRRGGAEILRGVDLAFEPGRRHVLIGASGAGKSTLLRLLNRLDDPDGGRILVGGRDLASIPPREVRAAVGLVVAAARPLPGTVAENLLYPHRVRGRSGPDRDAQAASLDAFGLDPAWLDRDARELSTGERQRLAIATALGAGPEILALDEPTAALDPASARRVAEILAAKARDEGLRTIVATHDRAHAGRLGDVGIRMDAGRVVDVGPIAEVLGRAGRAGHA